METVSTASDAFPDKWKEEFKGLLYLGHLEKEVTSIPFHKFVVRTLTVNEKLEVSLLTKDYIDTIGYNRAYRAAVVAAGLVSVDNRPLLPSDTKTNIFRQKWEYVTTGWYDAVIDTLYQEIDTLEGKVLEVLQELGMFKSDRPIPIFEDEKEGDDDPKGGK